MAGLVTDDRGVRILCPECGIRSHHPYAAISRVRVCSGCGVDAPTPAAPLEIATEAAFDALLADCPVPLLVDFWAPWCGPCLMVAPELEKVAARETGDLVVAKVNTDEVPALGQRFQILSIPTMSLFVGGREVRRAIGARPAEGILQVVTEALSEP